MSGDCVELTWNYPVYLVSKNEPQYLAIYVFKKLYKKTIRVPTLKIG